MKKFRASHDGIGGQEAAENGHGLCEKQTRADPAAFPRMASQIAKLLPPGGPSGAEWVRKQVQAQN